MWRLLTGTRKRREYGIRPGKGLNNPHYMPIFLPLSFVSLTGAPGPQRFIGQTAGEMISSPLAFRRERVHRYIPRSSELCEPTGGTITKEPLAIRFHFTRAEQPYWAGRVGRPSAQLRIHCIHRRATEPRASLRRCYYCCQIHQSPGRYMVVQVPSAAFVCQSSPCRRVLVPIRNEGDAVMRDGSSTFQMQSISWK
jgi:hypothetical protein